MEHMTSITDSFHLRMTQKKHAKERTTHEPMQDARGRTQPAEARGNGVDFDLPPATKRGRGAGVSIKHDIGAKHAQA